MDALFAGQGQMEGGSGRSGILPSNDSYRPTQGAIRHSEDTEFNDALRARGIIPPKPEERRSPSPDAISHAQALQNKLESADLEDDDDLLDLEDEDIPTSILEKYRSERMEEVKKLNKTRRYGSVLPIGRESYTREINEASEEDIDEDNPELKGKGTGVVCFLWKDGIPESTIMSRHLNTLAAAYPSTKFVSIRGDMCIANYPDKNIPTLLIYRKGHLVKQIIGLGGDVGLKGMKTSVLDVEALLILCDAIDPFLKVAPTQEARRRSDDEDSEEEGRTGRTQGIRRTVVEDDSDDDLDM